MPEPMNYTAKIEQTFAYPNRIQPFYHQITDGSEERVLIVSHGTALSFLQSMLIGCHFDDICRYRFRGHGGSVSKFLIDPDEKVTACYVNQMLEIPYDP